DVANGNVCGADSGAAPLGGALRETESGVGQMRMEALRRQTQDKGWLFLLVSRQRYDPLYSDSGYPEKRSPAIRVLWLFAVPWGGGHHGRVQAVQGDRHNAGRSIREDGACGRNRCLR